MDFALYMASGIGAIAVYLMMPRRGVNLALVGGLLGAITLGGLWMWLSRFLPQQLGMERAVFGYYYVFSAIAIVAAKT